MAAALASPARIPPTSQAMDSATLSPARPPSETGSDSSSFEQPDHAIRHLILSKITSLQSSISLRSEEYRQLFRLPSEEVLLQDFNCALQENILLQGHMYLFEHYVCFYSNIFGFETKKIISFQDVTSVRRAKTAGIFPNAIEIVAGGKKHFFASFLSRDEAFKLIVDGWSQCGGDLKGILDQQDSRSETSSQLNGFNSAENGNSSDSQVSDLDSDERNLEAPGSEENKLPPNNANDNAIVTVPDVVQEKPVAFADAEPSTSSGSVKWIEEKEDAPEIPDCYTKVAQSKFPISVKQFFNLFFSDVAIGFVESFHKKCGDKDLRCTSWLPHDKFGYRREKNFQHPIKVYFGAKCGGCKETQKFQVYKNSHLVIETSQEVSDVPYADYFTVEGIWDVQKDGGKSEECCVLQVYVSVAFSKKTMWKGKIEQSTVEECREAYGTWIQIAHELLQQKNIEKSEVRTTADVCQDGEADEGNSGNSGKCGEQSERLHSNADHRMSDRVDNSQASHEQTGNLLQGNLLDATTILSTLRAVALKFSTFLRSQGNLRLVIIAFFVILLLMQLSIVVLLSRPQQVYIVPQMESVTSAGLGVGYRAAETIHWIEKRMILLKDEMLIVEAQLERMRQEHILLRAQLKDLERLRRHLR